MPASSAWPTSPPRAPDSTISPSWPCSHSRRTSARPLY
ncbi:Uncharacterised protein [Bordetella pertussis]|nr:Uncharacterised protein [Bordetella pertussis]CFP58261.1 Uncharacterised protein [Bordetella pertussis]